MKNLIQAGLFLILLLLALPVQGQTTETQGSALAEHPSFRALARRLEVYAQRPKDLAEINRIAALSSVSAEDRDRFVEAMGFSSEEEGLAFDQSNIGDLQKVIADLNLGEVSMQQLVLVLEDGFEQVGEVTGSDCVVKFKRCKGTAWAQYGMDAVACGAVAGAFAGGTFFCAGCGGLAIGVACVTMAAVKLNNEIVDCRDDLVDCQGV